MARKPSQTQKKLMKQLPLLHSDLQKMDGNRQRTIKSLVDNGWASFGGMEHWMSLDLTDSGREMLK